MVTARPSKTPGRGWREPPRCRSRASAAVRRFLRCGGLVQPHARRVGRRDVGRRPEQVLADRPAGASPAGRSAATRFQNGVAVRRLVREEAAIRHRRASACRRRRGGATLSRSGARPCWRAKRVDLGEDAALEVVAGGAGAAGVARPRARRREPRLPPQAIASDDASRVRVRHRTTLFGRSGPAALTSSSRSLQWGISGSASRAGRRRPARQLPGGRWSSRAASTWIAPATGIAPSAPRMPASAAPISTATSTRAARAAPSARRSAAGGSGSRPAGRR